MTFPKLLLYSLLLRSEKLILSQLFWKLGAFLPAVFETELREAERGEPLLRRSESP